VTPQWLIQTLSEGGKGRGMRGGGFSFFIVENYTEMEIKTPPKISILQRILIAQVLMKSRQQKRLGR